MQNSRGGELCILRRDTVAAALQAVLDEYVEFAAATPPKDERQFAARHAAGKAAVGHMAALAKLLQWSICAEAGGTAKPASGPSVDDLLISARDAVSHIGNGAADDAAR